MTNSIAGHQNMESSPASFNTHYSHIDIENRVMQELQVDKGFIHDLISFDSDDDMINDHNDELLVNTHHDQEYEFEFPLIIFPDSSLQTDNIIHNHNQISPRYPLFDTSLLLNLDSNLDSKPAPAPATTLPSASAPTAAPISTSASVSAPAQAPVTTLFSASTPVPAPSASARLSLGKLLRQYRDSTQKSKLVLESNDLNPIVSPAEETYCIWKPQEHHHQPSKQHNSRGSRHKKSNSISIISDDTSSSKRWTKVRDLLKRSYSDDSKQYKSCMAIYSPPSKHKTGKDGSVVVFLPPISPKSNNEKVKKPQKVLKTTTASSMGGGCTTSSSHKPENKSPAYKAKIGNIRLPAFLPYRQDQRQVDAFANHNYKWVNCK